MPNPTSRQYATSTLHPLIRDRVKELLEKLHREGLNFQVFESWRSPQLQAKYFSHGRNTLGKVVNRSKVITYARPWSSFHQYGLAVDLVLKEGKNWIWNDRGANHHKWLRMHELAKMEGLKPLRFEKPHLQPASIPNWHGLYAGHYPGGGDEAWRKKMVETISGWKGTPASPPFPKTSPNTGRKLHRHHPQGRHNKKYGWTKIRTWLKRLARWRKPG